MNNKLLDFVMSTMCDEYCRYPIDGLLTNDDLDQKCEKCPLRLFMELFDK